ncbi:hypothetical protein KIK06_25015 [Nocardiopsis sp. EMB25]|uniref:hypothetical protein n=1 Tax=Nocardiopsis sp. EMB25 TaxID=2835867 RepID=UPI002284BD61|nr:hypothetical protein [Nocardiopsis sp. EMB25]MCY9787151.1 hypothetical protein [Nocardiopsis sp. EMB25]
MICDLSSVVGWFLIVFAGIIQLLAARNADGPPPTVFRVGVGLAFGAAAVALLGSGLAEWFGRC